jgi:hypothetical protein
LAYLNSQPAHDPGYNQDHQQLNKKGTDAYWHSFHNTLRKQGIKEGFKACIVAGVV